MNPVPCLILSILVALAPAPKGSKVRRETLPGQGVSLEVPKGWTTELTSLGTQLLCREHPARGVIAVLSMNVTPMASSLDGAASHHRGYLEEAFPGCRILGVSPSKAAGHDARTFHADRLGKGQPASELFDTLVAMKGRFVFVSLYFGPGRSEEYEPLYSKILDSLQAEEADLATEPERTASPSTSVPSAAPGTGGIRWRRSFDAAMEEARRRNVPILVCFNMDNEPACQAILTSHYEDPSIVALSERMVCLIGSTFDHGGDGSSLPFCPRFGSLTCGEHRDAEVRARETYIKSSVAVAPQHLLCAPDGRLLSRREYMLPRDDLARMMQGAMRAVERRGRYFPPGGEPDFFSYYEGARSAEERSEVIADVLYSGHPELAQRLFDQIAGSRREEGLLEILGTMAVVGHPAGVDHALGYLDSANEDVRAAAACALLSLADPRAVEGLQNHLRRERTDKVKQKILAALGASGAGDPKVASLLLRQAGSGASILRIHALLSLRHFPDEEKVRSTLLTAYRKEKNHEVKSAATIVLGYLRVEEAVPHLEKDLEGVGETVLANHIRWTLGCIRGTEDPELGWDDRMKSVSREGWQ